MRPGNTCADRFCFFGPFYFISLVYYFILFFFIFLQVYTSLRNVRQCYVTFKVTLVAKRNIYHIFIYFVSKYGGDGRTSSKLDKLYISYSPFIRKLIMNKLVYSLLRRSFNRFFPIRFMTVNVGYFKMLF